MKTAKDVMNKDVITVKPDDTVEYLVKLLLEKKIGGVPVVDDDNVVVGIVTETDLIYPEKSIHLPAFVPILDGIIFIESFKKLEKDIKKIAAYKVRDVMVKEVITVNEDAGMREVVDIIIDKRINRIPVVDKDKKLLGIITRSDILKNIY